MEMQRKRGVMRIHLLIRAMDLIRVSEIDEIAAGTGEVSVVEAVALEVTVAEAADLEEVTVVALEEDVVETVEAVDLEEGEADLAVVEIEVHQTVSIVTRQVTCHGNVQSLEQSVAVEVEVSEEDVVETVEVGEDLEGDEVDLAVVVTEAAVEEDLVEDLASEHQNHHKIRRLHLTNCIFY